MSQQLESENAVLQGDAEMLWKRVAEYERQRKAKAALDAAIAAYRQSERPGGEDRETDGLA